MRRTIALLALIGNLERVQWTCALSDGTTVELRLIEGGYVGYQELGWYFVKMPGDVFDAVLAACQ